jgi:hypothetical protein
VSGRIADGSELAYRRPGSDPESQARGRAKLFETVLGRQRGCEKRIVAALGAPVTFLYNRDVIALPGGAMMAFVAYQGGT